MRPAVARHQIWRDLKEWSPSPPSDEGLHCIRYPGAAAEVPSSGSSASSRRLVGGQRDRSGRSVDGDATVDGEDLARDDARLVRGQVDGHVCDVDRLDGAEEMPIDKRLHGRTGIDIAPHAVG